MIRSKTAKIIDLLELGNYSKTKDSTGTIYEFSTDKGTEFKLKDAGCEWQAFDPLTGKFEDCFTVAEVIALAAAAKDEPFSTEQNLAFSRIDI